MSKNKTVVVKSTVKETLPLHFMQNLQGNLKELPKESALKLRNSILKKGFLYPIFVWENKEDAQIYIIDGHQRHKVLSDLKEDGYKIPQLPVIFIPAESMQEAKENLAAAASQYGKFTEQGVVEFFGSFEVPPLEFTDIPFFSTPNIIELDEGFPPQETITVSEHERSKTVDLESYEKFEHKCERCGHEWSDK